jgi:type II secretory pathway component PulF
MIFKRWPNDRQPRNKTNESAARLRTARRQPGHHDQNQDRRQKHLGVGPHEVRKAEKCSQHRVLRRGGKLSDALTTTKALPPMAVRTLRLNEESGQLPMRAVRVADFYDAKLPRSLDRMMGIVGPLAIIVISTIVGGLIVSVMTALLSVNQVIN